MKKPACGAGRFHKLAFQDPRPVQRVPFSTPRDSKIGTEPDPAGRRSSSSPHSTRGGRRCAARWTPPSARRTGGRSGTPCRSPRSSATPLEGPPLVLELLVLLDKGGCAAKILLQIQLHIPGEDRPPGAAQEEQKYQNKRRPLENPERDTSGPPGQKGLDPHRSVALAKGQRHVPQLPSRAQLHQGFGVLPALGRGELIQGGLVAVQLQVQTHVPVGQPQQGIPPVEGQGKGDRRLDHSVDADPVVELVPEDQGHPLGRQVLLEVDGGDGLPIPALPVAADKTGG